MAVNSRGGFCGGSPATSSLRFSMLLPIRTSVNAFEHSCGGGVPFVAADFAAMKDFFTSVFIWFKAFYKGLSYGEFHNVLRGGLFYTPLLIAT